MTGPDGIDVRPTELETHAAALDRVSRSADTANQRARGTALSGDAYGKLCWPIIIPLHSLQDLLTDAISAAADAADDGARRLEDAAQRYRRSDSAAAERHNEPRPAP